MRRIVRGLVPWMALGLAAACGGDDGESGTDDLSDDASDDGGDDAGDDGDGPGEVTCAGEVSGDVVGDFAPCRAVIVQYPEGTPILEGRDGWLFSLVATTIIGTLDPPLESVGLNFEVAGEPTTGTFRLSDTVPGVTSGTVSLVDDSYFDTLGEVTLVVSSLEEVLDEVQDGYRVVSFELSGTLDMALEGQGGGSVSVSASF